jgi:hypothetical protein
MSVIFGVNEDDWFKVSAVLGINKDGRFKVGEQVFESVASLTALNLRKSQKLDSDSRVSEQVL